MYPVPFSKGGTSRRATIGRTLGYREKNSHVHKKAAGDASRVRNGRSRSFAHFGRLRARAWLYAALPPGFQIVRVPLYFLDARLSGLYV